MEYGKSDAGGCRLQDYVTKDSDSVNTHTHTPFWLAHFDRASCGAGEDHGAWKLRASHQQLRRNSARPHGRVDTEKDPAPVGPRGDWSLSPLDCRLGETLKQRTWVSQAWASNAQKR